MKNIYLYISMTMVLLFAGTIHSSGQIVKVSLSGNNLCNNYLEVGIYVQASDFSTADFEIGSSSFFFNYNPAIANYVSYTPVEFNATTSSTAAGANWIDQAMSNDGECGLLNLVLQKEDGGFNNYELNKTNPVLVGTVLMEFVNGEADPDIQINQRFTMFNSGQTNDGTAMVAIEDYPKVQNYTCANNCTAAVITNINTNSTSCSQSSGLIAISFPDAPNRTNIEFSIDGGFTFPFNTLDDVGTYEITGLSAATFDLWVRWGDDSCPYNLGPVSINATNGPEAALSSIESACGDQANGSLILEFIDNPNRTDIEFSLDGGLNYAYSTQDDLLTLNIVGLAAGTYDLWVRWGNDECPVDMEDPTIYANDPPEVVTANYDICGLTTAGSIVFDFTDLPSQNSIEFSLDGGNTYPYTINDNLLSLAVDNLSVGTYDAWARWGDGQCAIDLGGITIGNDTAPTATVTQDNACADSDEGEIRFEFVDDPNRTGIQFSINGGLSYQYIADNSATYTFGGLAPGTYDCLVKWGNNECPLDLGTRTIGIHDSPTAFASAINSCDDGENGSIVFDFPNHPTRTGIAFSIDNGLTYQYSDDNLGSYQFDGLSVGTYPVWVRWGDEDCPTYLENITIANNEIVENGDFSSLEQEWYVYINEEATATYDYAEEVFSTNITNPGTIMWHIELIQSDVPIINGHNYQVSFRAKAEADRNIQMHVSQNGPDIWTAYYWESIPITSEWEYYNYTFVSDSTDAYARLVFDLGLEDIDVEIDDVSMINLDDNVEVIQNGNFDNGDDYWYFYVNAEAEATSDYVDEVFSIDVIDPGSLSWHVQLIQEEVPIIDGHTYQFSFNARSDIDRQIRTYVAQNGPDIWTAYFYVEPLLTPEWQSYTYTFVSDSTDAYARVVFDVGLDAIDVQIDDVSVVDLDCEEITAPWITPQLCVNLEGTYDTNSGSMTNTLQQTDNLPDVQPYNQTPWNHEGNEGLGWTAADYPAGSVDWVLVSFRTGTTADTEIAQTAAIVQQDGCLYFPDENVLSADDAGNAPYVVIQHRNHIAVMTPQPIQIINNTLTYDFRFSDSYKDNASFGQKQLSDGTWAMFAGDADQFEPLGYDINGLDKSVWVNSNGIFDGYFIPDFNQDGDVNGADKIMWFSNNGISSSVPK